MIGVSSKWFWGAIALAGITVAGVLGVAFLNVGLTIQELLTENRELKEAIGNLTTEDQIGYAKVVEQIEVDGKLMTTIKFVETSRTNPLEKLFEESFVIEGDVIHFDALIVKFDNQLVQDGKARSLYLWRRVYGEQMKPANGFPIEVHGKEPLRYKDNFSFLSKKESALFWAEIWDLAHNKKTLREYGIDAVFGNVVYTQLQPGLIYIFKIDSTGQVYPEVIPDM